MDTTDTPEWTIDMAGSRVRHSSGLIISFEGVPDSDDFSGSPQHMPRNLTALALARLIREGFEAFRTAYNNSASKNRRTLA